MSDTQDVAAHWRGMILTEADARLFRECGAPASAIVVGSELDVDALLASGWSIVEGALRAPVAAHPD